MKIYTLLLFIATFTFANQDQEERNFRVFYSEDYETRTEARYVKYCPDSLFLTLERRNHSKFEEKLTEFSIEDRIYVVKEHQQIQNKKLERQMFFTKNPKGKTQVVIVANTNPFDEPYLGALFRNHWTHPERKLRSDYRTIINRINLKRNNYDYPVELKPNIITGERVIVNLGTGERVCGPSGCR